MIVFLVLALFASNAGAQSLVCKQGFKITCLEEDLPPEPEPEPEPPKNFMLPIEVLGPKGTTKTIGFNVDKPGEATTLYLMLNSLNYQDKGSIKINDGPWVSMNYRSLKLEHKSIRRGGMERGAPHTFKSSMPIALSQKANKISFRYEKVDGLSIGYRVVELDVRDNEGVSLLSLKPKVDDPKTWAKPEGSNPIKGKKLWLEASLVSNDLKENGKWYAHTLISGAPIKATCSDCHVKDGRDLKMFGYSNLSIIERSKFHGLSEEDGKHIAAYIRELPVADKGRPWNPPYQPSPNIDLDNWYAGGGVEAVLEKDEHMLDYLFDKKPITQAMVYDFMDNKKMVDTSKTPLAIMLPDWKQWLPILHPKDAFKNEYYEKSEAFKGYIEITSYLQASKDYTNPTLFNELHSFWLGFRRFFEAGATSKNHWRSKGSTAMKNVANPLMHQDLVKTSMARLLAVKMFEIHQMYKLEMLGDKLINANELPRKNTWLGRQYNIFEVPPHFTSCTEGSSCSSFVGQTEKTGLYESTAWYQLQQVINPGIGMSRSVVPVDYNYQPQFILKASNASKIPEPIRFWYSQNVMYQTRIRTEDIEAGDKEGFNMRTMGVWTALGTDNRNRDYGVDIVGDTNRLQDKLGLYFVNANVRQFLLAMRHPRNNVKDWPRRPIASGEHRYLEDANLITPEIMPDPAKPYRGMTRHYAHKFYWAIPRLRDLGVDCKLIEELASWSTKAWAKVDFKQFTCK